MGKIRNVVSVFLAVLILICCRVTVAAENTQIDWSNIDLENYDYSDFEMEQWQSLRDWLKKDADLHTVFYVTTTKGDGYVGELWADLVYSLFMRDPVPFIQALALEDESTQNLTSSRIAYGSPHEKDEFK